MSNVWFYPITIGLNRSREQQLSDIKRLQTEYGITKIINMDDELQFWWSQTEQYLPEIQQQLNERNIKKIEKKLKSYTKLILQSNLLKPYDNILFVSINTIECMFALHIYLYLKITGISKDDRNLTLGVIEMIKLKYPFQISIENESLKTLIL